MSETQGNGNTRQAFAVTATRASTWDDAEVRRRLGRAYALILNYRTKSKEMVTAGRGEFGDLTRPAADDAPAVEPETPDAL